jgi:hypothetical protein
MRDYITNYWRTPMKGKFSFVLVLAFTLSSSGCAVFKHLDGSTGEEIDAHVSGRKMAARTTAPEKVDQYANREDQLRISREMKGLKRELAAQKERVAKLEEERLQTALDRKAKPVEVAARGKRDLAHIKIKVLSGDGKFKSAKAMAKRLKKMGYKINRLDLAPRANFKMDTVFYAKNFSGEAREMAKRLGGNAITKPLTWNSIFDIIVVKGKSR